MLHLSDGLKAFGPVLNVSLCSSALITCTSLVEMHVLYTLVLLLILAYELAFSLNNKLIHSKQVKYSVLRICVQCGPTQSVMRPVERAADSVFRMHH